MKKELELCVFLANYELVEQIEETLRIIEQHLNTDITRLLDPNVKENQSSLTLINDFFYVNYGKDYKTNIERLYFGIEVCEYLIPKLEEIKKVIEICEENDYGFTFVTPYVGPEGMKKLEIIFEYLNTLDDIEVVVNDYGVLHRLINSYTNLIPVIGRLLVKLNRDPRFSISGYDISEKDVKNANKIRSNQTAALQENSIDIKIYRDFLKKHGVTRISIDAVVQGINFKKIKSWEFPIDFYWPWTYITSGRNCNIAGHIQPGKQLHPTDEPCIKQCRLYEFTFRSDKKMFTSIQRGTTVWMNSHILHKQYFKPHFGRLIYEPYIPL